MCSPMRFTRPGARAMYVSLWPKRRVSSEMSMREYKRALGACQAGCVRLGGTLRGRQCPVLGVRQ